jgi:penicillin-binding protein 1A
MRPGGAVVAMVGGRDYGASQFNRATQALRQPGSAFKLFVYLAAIEAGIRPGDEVEDAPVNVEGWTPRNAAGDHRGTVTVREAAARSINSVAVTLAEKIGRGRVRDVALKLGITSDLGDGPSLALGAYEVSLLELTAAYAVIANRGNGVWPWAIREIRTGDGTVLFRRSGGGPGRVAEPADVAAINDIFTAAITWGTGRAAKLDRPSAGKTGTSQDSRDAWFIGYTPDLVAGIWLGNDDNSPMKGVGGGSFPARAWRDFMVPALKGVPPKPLPGVAPPATN